MRAGTLARRMGKKLVGRQVITPAEGAYPGGLATVTEVGHDPKAPEIVFLVQHPTWRDEDDGDGIMGIFEYEEVELVEDLAPKRPTHG